MSNNYFSSNPSNGINSYVQPEPEFPSSPSSTPSVRGGVTSIQFGIGDQGGITDDYAPDVRDLGSRVRSGEERYVWNSEGGEVRKAGVQSVNMNDFSYGMTGIFETVQSSSFGPVNPGNLQPSDTISVDGVRFSLEVAERIGLVSRDQNGRYVEVAQTPVQARQEVAEGPVGEAFSPSAEAGLTALVNATTPDSQVALFSELARTGDVSEAVLGRMASEAGVEPHEMARWVQGVMGEFEGQAERSLAKMGVVDPIAFASWAADNGYQSEVSDAMYRHITERTTEGYKPLAERFVLDLDRFAPDLILSAEFGQGIRAIRGNDGVPLIEIDGKTYGWASAVRAGLVRLS
jgi:hypothetical protein